MRLRHPNYVPLLLMAALTVHPGAARAQIAQEAVDLSVVQQIREEGLERSQIEELAQYLVEVIGPRLTGSPGMRRANEWTLEKFQEWGLANASMEPWGEFGRGWSQEDFRGRILTPFVQPLQGQPQAWTGSTDGLVRGPAVIIRAETAADAEQYRGQFSGAFVLIEPLQEVEPEWEHRDRRTSLEDLLEPESAEDPMHPSQTPAEMQARMERRRAQQAIQTAIFEIAREEGANAVLRSSSRGDGVLSGFAGGSREAGAPEGLAQVGISREQYNQIFRNVTNGVPVELEMQVTNRFYEDDLQQYNSLAEIPGTDKADEYVMLGAHLDSWHMGGGATDNAAGSIVMMEAIRILKTLGLQPRRTIRIALWSGEEQGLLGSRAYVANHPELRDKISAYLNVDNGSGRIRGIWNQSNEQAVPVFEQLLWPFRDLGVVAVRRGDTGGTDHLAFDAVGIPGFNFIQDPIEYSVNTHHTNLDTFDHLVIDDLRQAAVVVASTVYALAMREEMMPRKEEAPTSSR